MRRLTYENSKGEKIVFYLTPFLIESLTGIGEVGTDIQSQSAPYQDGSTYIDTRLEPRFITLEGPITTKNLVEIRRHRREISRICNPKLGLGMIKLELDGDIKQIQGTLDGGVFFPERGQSPWQKFMVTWKCPNPYWQSETIIEEPAFEPLFRFPFEGTFEMGMQRDQRIIINDGDAPTPLRIEFFGPAINPKIINNTTKEFIKINQELLENERMKIDTADGNKSIYFIDENGNERNVFNWIDLDSTFFKLGLGENEIEYTADGITQGAVVSISYNKLYVAI